MKEYLNKIVNISPDYHDLLYLLFPQLSIRDKFDLLDRVIVNHDVTSQEMRNKIEYLMSDYIIISSVLFDELWDSDKLVQLCLQFKKLNFKSRVSTYKGERDCESLIRFLYNQSDNQSDMNLLIFDVVGSKGFAYEFIKMSEIVPPQVIQKSIITFLSKINSSTSLFYLKAKSRIGKAFNDDLFLRNSLDFYKRDKMDVMDFVAFHDRLFNIT